MVSPRSPELSFCHSEPSIHRHSHRRTRENPNITRPRFRYWASIPSLRHGGNDDAKSSTEREHSGNSRWEKSRLIPARGVVGVEGATEEEVFGQDDSCESS